MALEVHVVGPRHGHSHTHSVIFLHGRDSNCEEFAAEFFESEASEPAGEQRTLLDLFPTIRWVFPRAPMLHSQRFDTPMSQWYDMWSVEGPAERVELQQSGLKNSVNSILDIIQDEERHVSRDKIFLGGISQGFSTAVAAFIAGGSGFAGLLGFCSWMPLGRLAQSQGQDAGVNGLDKIRTLYHTEDGSMVSVESMQATPVLLTHSIDDNVVPIENGRALREVLAHVLRLKVEWHEYIDGGHWINEPRGVDDIVAFLAAQMR